MQKPPELSKPEATEKNLIKMVNSTEGLLFCLSSVESIYIFNVWFIIYLSFLPVFLFVLYIGFNKWKNQRSSASGNISHSDAFTFNTVTMELTGMIGAAVTCYGYHSWDKQAVNIGITMVVTTSFGQVFFHSLTCVERYLAVIHPVTYMRLKTGGAVTIRNVSIAFVWIFSIAFTLLFCFAGALLYNILAFVLAILPAPFVVFHSVAILCVLIRPKPGDRKQVDQSKRSTFYTMVVIVGVLVLKLVFDVAVNIIFVTAGKLPQCK